MSKKLPNWLPLILLAVFVFLTAFLTGQWGALYLRGQLKVPHRVVIKKEKSSQKAKPPKALVFYESDVLPILEGKNKEEEIEKKKAAPKKAAPGEPVNPVDTVDWNGLIGSNPDSIIVNGTMIGWDSAIALVNVNGTDMTLSLNQEVGSYHVDSITKSAVIFRKKTGAPVMVAMNLDGRKRAPVKHTRTSRVRPGTSAQPDLNDIVSYQGNKRVVDRRKFNALLKPPSRLANEIKFIPHSKDGKPYGIRISYLKPGSFFTKIGMRSGDIFQKINQKEIKTVEDSFYAYQAFRNEEHILIEVERGGKMVQIPLEFR